MNITKKLVIGISSVLAIFGLLVGGKKIMKQVEYNEMEKVVYSEEAHEVYKKDLLSIDKNAFSDKGIIKTYNISSFERNPMGGIIVYLYVNIRALQIMQFVYCFPHFGKVFLCPKNSHLPIFSFPHFLISSFPN